MGSRRLDNPTQMNVSLIGGTIDNGTEFKYLSILLDQYMLFNKHIDYAVDYGTTKLSSFYKNW